MCSPRFTEPLARNTPAVILRRQPIPACKTNSRMQTPTNGCTVLTSVLDWLSAKGSNGIASRARLPAASAVDQPAFHDPACRRSLYGLGCVVLLSSAAGASAMGKALFSSEKLVVGWVQVETVTIIEERCVRRPLTIRRLARSDGVGIASS
jgi:hypothetical protein